MAAIFLTTYKDTIDRLIDFMGGDPGELAFRAARQAIRDSLNELSSCHSWIYFYQRGRFNTVQPYNTGTISYTQSSRSVFLSGGTFPTWAVYGTLLVNNIVYPVVANPNATTLILSSKSNPGVDIVAGTSYTLYQDMYVMPSDFVAADELINTNNFLRLTYEHPRSWLSRQRILHSPATPRIYTFMGHPVYQGQMAAAFFPPPDNIYAFDFLYKRRARPVLVDSYAVGSISASAGSQTVTGNGTQWTNNMLGSVIRLSSDSTHQPTNIYDLNPTVQERIIVSVVGPTEVIVDTAVDTDYNNVLYYISDPIDLEEGAMLNAFFACCYKHVGRFKKMEDLQRLEKQYTDAVILAREADVRSIARRTSGDPQGMWYRLRDFPRGADVP